MAHPNPSRLLRAASALALLAALSAAAPAQSGRKAQKSPGLPAGDAPKAADPAAEKPEAKKPEPAVSFVVMRADTTAIGIDPYARDGVAAAFRRRLGQASTVAVTDGGRGSRPEARERAKKEEKAYVVLFQLEEQAGDMSMGRPDYSTLILRTYVYTPKAGDLKYTDTVFQRPFYDSTRVGGVRVPIPTRRVERYPAQHELEQAARDAADRLLSRFQVAAPQDNE